MLGKTGMLAVGLEHEMQIMLIVWCSGAWSSVMSSAMSMVEVLG